MFSRNLNCATAIPPDSVIALFGRVRDEVGYRHVHLHSLRQFAATQLAADPTIPVRTVAGPPGHADASLPMKVYAAHFPAFDGEAAEVVGRALQRGGQVKN